MTGWDAGSAGIDPGRVAELMVTPAEPGPGRRGSGYRISASAVLTAAHVVRDGARVRVRFNADRPGQWLTEGKVEWSDLAVDVAVITTTPRPEDEGQVAPVAFGRVAERDAVLTCSAMGFPRFKLRNDPGEQLDDGSPSQYRDSVHAVGTIAVLSNRREGTLEVSVSPPEHDPDPDRSPWEGMSGAAVWSAGRIIGLVAEHHRSDGLGRLAATRVDRWYERLPPDQLDVLRGLTGLPARSYELPEVVPPTSEELLEAGYAAQVRDIAPDVLLGREQDLAELVQFCAGEERYQWWQAGPWAGKSALAAWFVLHPPAGVSVVSFFVTGRLAGQADSDAFTEAMVEQLAAVVGEPAPATATPAGRDRDRRRLLDQAATRVGERGGRLLLVVDGLDEDEGAEPGGGKPSIASLLPKRPPDAVRVLVFSRPSPGVPGDVPGDHPLRRCTPRSLAPSPYAEDVRLQAKQELLERLHGDQLQVDVIGFITASGGGLTLRELAELSRQPRYLLDGKLGSVFGRSLRTRLASDERPEDAERVYLFAHETLRTTAEEELAGDLGPYRQRIDAWADDYRAQGWPDSTPRYVLRPYGRLLAAIGDLQRLVALACDPLRHQRMLVYTQSDAAALSEIATTQQLLPTESVPDLVALACLAVHRERLANRNRAVPAGLPALWALLGQSQRGEALARSIPDPNGQAQALAAVAGVLSETDRDRAVSLARDAEQAARRITDPDDQAEALFVVTEALAEAKQWEQAEQVARSIANPHGQAQALAAVARALSETDRDRAVSLARDAEQAARSVPDPNGQARVLAAVAVAVAGADWDRAVSLARDAERTAHGADFQYEFDRPWALAAVAATLANGWFWDQAEQTARSITNPYAQVRALAAVAAALVEADRDRALTLARDAEQAARRITSPDDQADALAQVAEALMDADRGRALTLARETEQAARSITNPDKQADALAALADILAGGRLWVQAEQMARSITDPRKQADALVDVTELLAAAKQWDQVEQMFHTITDPRTQVLMLTVVAPVLSEADRDRAMSLATDAEQAARSITDLHNQAEALFMVANAMVAAKHWGQAEQIARNITNSYAYAQADVLAAVATALTQENRNRLFHLAMDTLQVATPITHRWTPAQGLIAVAAALTEAAAALTEADRDRALSLATDAEQAAHNAAHPDTQAEVLAAVAWTMAFAMRSNQAEQVAHRITDPYAYAQARGLVAVAAALSETDRDRTLSLATDAEQAARSITYPPYRARALAATARALTEADRDHAVSLATDAEQAARSSAARSSSERSEQTEALLMVTEVLAAAKQWDQAEQVAHSLTMRDAEVQALAVVAAALTETDRERARSLAMDAHGLAIRAADRWVRDQGLAAVARAMVGARLWDQAEQAAHGLTDRDWEVEVWTTLAKALVGARQWDQAEQLTQRIASPHAQAQVCLVIADAFITVSAEDIAVTGESLRRRASRLLAVVLAGEEWPRAMPLLGKLNLPGVVQIYEAASVRIA